jgi:hypothetical protein
MIALCGPFLVACIAQCYHDVLLTADSNMRLSSVSEMRAALNDCSNHTSRARCCVCFRRNTERKALQASLSIVSMAKFVHVKPRRVHIPTHGAVSDVSRVATPRNSRHRGCSHTYHCNCRREMTLCTAHFGLSLRERERR